MLYNNFLTKGIKIVLFSTLFIFPLSVCLAQESIIDNNKFQQVWSDFSDVSMKIMDSKGDFVESISKHEPKYTKLLKQAQGILSNSLVDNNFNNIETLRKANNKLNSDLTDLKKQRLISMKNPSKREKLDKTIKSCIDEINKNENKIESEKKTILNYFASQNIKITPEELNYFLISAEGNELMKLMNIAENMKRIQLAIERELEHDSKNIDLVKIYSGMYMISLDAYHAAHEVALKNIPRYIDKINVIVNEAQKNLSEAKLLQRFGTDAHHAANSISINDKVIEVANLYTSLLNRRSENLRQSQRKVHNKLAVAKNTFKSIDNGSLLINLVNDGSNEYTLIVSFDMPELKTIYNDAMMGAFTNIAERIKTEQ